MNANASITSDMTPEAILEAFPKAEAVLVKHFGAGLTMPGQTWMAEPLSRVCLMRGVNEKQLVSDLRKSVA